MAFVDNILDRIGHWLAGQLNEQRPGYEPYEPASLEALQRTLQPCDVLLVEGGEKISTAIKYLTQSTWSHAALYVGDMLDDVTETGERRCLIEANLGHGVVASPLSRYAHSNTRICRPIGLTPEDRQAIMEFAADRIGFKYDLRNIIDLARYMFPTPPIPLRWRRQMISLGSGEPTRAICSTLIAQAFQEVRYPILPRVEQVSLRRAGFSDYRRWEILHIRHHSLYTPRDFDLSPYFRVVKPTVEYGFDYKQLNWASELPVPRARGGRAAEGSQTQEDESAPVATPAQSDKPSGAA